MTIPDWPEWLDELVAGVRFSRGDDDWWASADMALREPQSAKTMHFLAVLGLVELVTQSHRIDREKEALCAGDELAVNFLRSRGFTEDDGSERTLN